MNEYEMTSKSAYYYKENSRPIHISCHSGKFYNGYIVEILADFLIINDFKLGEMPVFFMEMKILEPYKSPNQEIQKGGEQ